MPTKLPKPPYRWIKERTKCERCTATSVATGARCKRNTCAWAPYCFQHTPVYVANSAVSGLGVFAKKNLPRGQVLSDFTVGTKKMTAAELERNYPGNTPFDHGLCLRSTPTNIGPCYNDPNGYVVASRFNMCKPRNRRNGKCPNGNQVAIQLRGDGYSGKFVLTKAVSKDDELFLDYGPDSNYF